MAIPKKRTLLKTKKQEEVQKLVQAINDDKQFGYEGLRPIAKNFFLEYVRGGMSPKAAYSKMKNKMKTIDMDEIMGIVADTNE
jgi:hypothetical protein